MLSTIVSLSNSKKMKNQIFRIAFIALLMGFVVEVNAQSANPEPIFGTVVVKKINTDSTHKKSSFNLLRPAYFRLGLMGGSTISLDNNQGERAGGLLGLRAEYGLTNRFSVLGQFQNNFRGMNGAFPDGQASLGVNWMPFKSRRLQPFVGLAVGVGRNNMGFGRNGFRGDKDRFHGGGSPTFDNDSLRRSRNVNGFGLARVGVNYVIARRIIGTLEGSYQIPFNGSSNTNGGVSVAMGLSYQFGRIKK